MIAKIKCFVCDGLTLDDLECRICEGKGQIESLLKLSVEDLKIWAERLQQQQQELDAQHHEIHEMENRLVQREEEIQNKEEELERMRADLDNSLDAYELYNDKYKELNDHYLSKVRKLQSEMSKRNEEFQQLCRKINNSGAPSSDQDQAAIMRELVVSLSKLITELEKKEDFLLPPQ